MCRVTEFRVLEDSTAWREDVERRLVDAYATAGLGAAAAQEYVTKGRALAGDWTVAEIADAGARVGCVAVRVGDERGVLTGRIGDLHIDAGHTGRGHERAAREWAERWCAEQGARRVGTRLTDPALGEVFAAYGVRGQVRVRPVGAAPEPVDGVTERPMTQAEYTQWLAREQEAYADGIVRSGAMSRADAVRKSDQDFAELLPEGLATPDTTLLVLEAAGEPIGTGWLKHGYLPGVTYGYSLHVHEAQRGKGYGRAAMAVGERATFAAGESALMFTVWGGNEVAMNLYTSAGYGILDEERSAELP
ncbi:GNAT family N-acetyltransferase [Streptomyces griseofuscus]|uniref:GNAT family N-acetyltransferase n=1 Tax=Streptomyces griseofuscus TaxID=146922 RepID=UPI00081F3230|nr:Ribosomal protein S18 acetylase RimI [Streptomyces sp. DconLS]SCF73969.1 Ribosomal protein S18 acetylase RimI [Streptomyces sp. LamerLS-31b]